MARSASEHGPHYVDQHVGRRMAERRISLGHNQSEVGRAIGITFQQVQKYEKGTNRISSSRLWEAAAFLGVPVGWFFEGLAGTSDDAASQVSVPEQAFPATRYSVEIHRLAPRLSTGQQKVILDLLKVLAQADAERS